MEDNTTSGILVNHIDPDQIQTLTLTDANK